MTRILNDSETQRLDHLRVRRAADRQRTPDTAAPLTLGQRVADRVAITMGSWRFIIIQSVVLAIWVTLNIVAYIRHWDPYPFILLNLVLSFQAAYAAPIIMMSQNRQQDIDRRDAAQDYQINVKAELEIELLHQKIDALREQEVLGLTKAVQELTHLLRQSEQRREGPPPG